MVCPLGDALAWPIQSEVKRFPEDFEKHFERFRIMTSVLRLIAKHADYEIELKID